MVDSMYPYYPHGGHPLPKKKAQQNSFYFLLSLFAYSYLNDESKLLT